MPACSCGTDVGILPRRDRMLLAELDGLLAGLIDAAGDCAPETRRQAARMLVQLGLRGLAAADGATVAAAYLHALAERLQPAGDGNACRCRVLWAEPVGRRPFARDEV